MIHSIKIDIFSVSYDPARDSYTFYFKVPCKRVCSNAFTVRKDNLSPTLIQIVTDHEHMV